MKKIMVVGVVMLFALVASVQAYYELGIRRPTCELAEENDGYYMSHTGWRWCGHQVWWGYNQSSDQRVHRTYKWWTS